MKSLKIFSIIVVLTAFFAGCEKNESISGNEPEMLMKSGSNVHAVYTISNSASGNEVIVYRRAGNGTLSEPEYFPTGGTGTGAGLGSQGAVIDYSGIVYAVNAGSNEISALSTGPEGLMLVDIKSSGGIMPISVTAHKDLLYVLNAGGSGNISGFRINKDGSLSAIAGAIKPLSSVNAGPAQIEFSPDGKFLVVTEKATNSIVAYAVGNDGVAEGPYVQPSAGQTPFGFAFDKRGHIIVSEAFGGNALAGAMSSYNIQSGEVNLITGPVYNMQTAPCWVVVTKNGKFAYTTNTGTSNISGYSIRTDGSIVLFNDGGNTAMTGSGSAPIDMAVSNDSQYLYALSKGSNTISVFRINNGNGSLMPVQTISGIPSSASGLAGN